MRLFKNLMMFEYSRIFQNLSHFFISLKFASFLPKPCVPLLPVTLTEAVERPPVPLTPSYFLLTPHYFLFPPHFSLLPISSSLLTPTYFLLTPHSFLFPAHSSLLPHHSSLPTTSFHSLLIPLHSSISTSLSELTTRYFLLFINHHSLFQSI